MIEDDAKLDPYAGRKKKKKFNFIVLFFGSFILGFTTVTLLFFPIFNGRSGLDIIKESLEVEDKKLVKLGDDIPEPYIVEHFIPPSNSFGMGETNFTYVNWSFFWQKFRSNSRWDMEGWHPIQEEWVSEYQGNDLDDYLNISRIRSDDNSSEKITLNFTSPYTTRYRFTFGIDARVLNFVNKTDRFEYVLTYPINGTDDNYTVFFNWSDLIPMLDNDTISVNHGIKNVGGRDVFWFRIITNVDLQEGISYLLDPTFGGSSGSDSGAFSGNGGDRGYVLASYDAPASNGNVDSITFKTAALTVNMVVYCGLYEYVDYSSSYAGDLIAVTETKSLLSTDGNKEFTVDFSDPKPSIVEGTNYYIAFCPQSTSWSTNSLICDNGGDNSVYHYSHTSFPDPLASENSASTTFYLYASYTEVSNTAPSASNPNPTDGETNTTISEKYNVTAWDIDGDSLTVDFYISTDNSTWIHLQTNSSHTANTSCEVNLLGQLNYNDVYYMKTTVNDTTDNISFYSSFETTPYRSSFFNDTFPSETWIKDSNGMVYQDSWYNNSLASGGNIYYDDFENNDWGNYTPGCSGSCADADHYIDATGYLFDSYTAQIKDEAYFNLSSSFDASGYDTICADYWFMFKSYNGAEDWDTQYYNKTAGDWTTVKTHDFGDYDNVEDYHEVVWFNTSDGLDLSDSFNIRFMTQSNVGNGDYLYFDNIYINGTASGGGGSQNISSEEIFRIGGTTWDKFYADVNDTTHCSFSLRDYDTDYNITTGLVGNGDDISSVTNSSFYIYGNFSNALVSMNSWNVSWTSGSSEPWSNVINTINGSFSNSTKTRTLDSTKNGSYSNSTSFKVINNDINGSYSSTTQFQNIISTINGSYSNNTKFNDIISTINGSYSNNTIWKNIINTINGSWSAVTVWNTVTSTINGSYTNTTLFQNIITTINGSYSNTTEDVWKNIINTINGSYSNTTLFQNIISTINGSYSNSTSFKVINNEINGSYSNTSINTAPYYSNLDPVNGAVDVPIDDCVIRIDINDTEGDTFTYNWSCSDGSYNMGGGTNGTKVLMLCMVGLLNYNTMYTWWINTTDEHGAYTNSTFSFNTTDGTWNTVIGTINGSYSNSTEDVWNNVINTINGSFSNSTKIRTVDSTKNGSYSNSTIMKEISSDKNGTYSNQTAYKNIILTINGSYSNETITWNTDDNTINGTYSNTSGITREYLILNREKNYSYIYLLFGFMIGIISIFLITNKKKRRYK